MPHRLSACVFTVLLLVGTTQAADPVPGVTVMGGVADPPNKVVYLSDPAGSVVALDIDKGTLLWETKDATRPVASLGKKVYALAAEKGKTNVFRVVTLDADDKGKVIKTSDPIALPDWANVGDLNDRSALPRPFQCIAELKDSTLKVRWWAFSKTVNKTDLGEASIDLSTGKATTAVGKDLPSVQPKHSKEVQAVINKRSFNSADPIVATGDRVFGRFSGTKGDGWVLTLHVADLKTGELLWKRAYQDLHRSSEK